MRRIISGTLVLFSLLFSISNPTHTLAQTSPLSLPLFDSSKIVYKGSFTYDWPDGAGGDISYGGSAVGVSEDGQYIYIACNVVASQMGIAKLRIPTIGGRATVVQPCSGPNSADFSKILPARDGGSPRLGGILEQNGRVTVTGYWTYDANGSAIASHWSGPSLTNLSGPYLGAWKSGSAAASLNVKTSGFVKDHLTPIPSEWRSTLGGPALSTAGYTSIISRASYGASVSVFDPATVTQNGFQLDMLLGCPDPISSCRTYGTPTSNNYNGSELSGGAFIIPGTRTLAAIERESSGPTCYGYTTTDPTLHGTPYPSATNPSPEGVVWCYSLSDPMNQKGPKGYPYRLVAKLYDLSDLVSVKNGTKNPWDIRQYATIDMPSSSAGESVSSGSYNPVTNEYYLIRYTGGGVNTVYVYGGFSGGGTSSGGDITAPVVSITSPTSGAAVSGSSVSVSANATDNVNVSGVQFKLNGVNLGLEDTTAPYSIIWNTTTHTNGNYVITAVARDSSGNTATASNVNVNINNISVVSPTADIKVNGGDSSVKINSGSSVTISWTSTNATSCSVAPGSYTGTNGSQSVTPTSNTTYTLTCSGSGGSVTDSVSVNVITPTIQSPTADIKVNGSDGPISVPATSGVNLTWASTNATSCSVSPGGYSGLTGTQTTSAIEAGRTFVLSCTGPGGTKTDNVVVKPSSATTTDTIKPTVNITAPSSYTAIKGVPILVTADATDNIGVAGVQFKLDGVNLGSEDTTSSYSTLWDTTNATEGAHILIAVARDAAGNIQTSAGVTVTIPSTDTTDITKPSVSITSPSSNSLVSGSVIISASASDNVGVTGVQFKLNGSDLLSEDSTSPYSLTWNTDTVSDGKYTLTAVARDAAGNTQTSSVSVTVAKGESEEPVVPPSVSITAPSAGSTLSNTVTVSANAEDNVGVMGVQFKLDGVNLLLEDTTAPYSISWDTKNTKNGTHVLTATARDTEGNQTTSSSVSVSVSNEGEVSTGLKVGDKVKTTAWVNIRSTAGGRWIGSQRAGRTGTITAGPEYANNLTWWKVNFTSGVDGWVAGNYLTKQTVAMTEDDYRKNIANIYLLIKHLQERIAGQD
jgi:hypothetical protein